MLEKKEVITYKQEKVIRLVSGQAMNQERTMCFQDSRHVFYLFSFYSLYF